MRDGVDESPSAFPARCCLAGQESTPFTSVSITKVQATPHFTGASAMVSIFVPVQSPSPSSPDCDSYL